MDALAIDKKLQDAVAAVRAKKLERIAKNYEPKRRKRKPRFCITTTLQLCPRQRAKKYKAS